MPSDNDARRLPQPENPCNENPQNSESPEIPNNEAAQKLLVSQLKSLIESKLVSIDSPEKAFYVLEEMTVAIAVATVEALNAMESTMEAKDPRYHRGAFYSTYIPIFMDMIGARCIKASPENAAVFSAIESNLATARKTMVH